MVEVEVDDDVEFADAVAVAVELNTGALADMPITKGKQVDVCAGNVVEKRTSPFDDRPVRTAPLIRSPKLPGRGYRRIEDKSVDGMPRGEAEDDIRRLHHGFVFVWSFA